MKIQSINDVITNSSTEIYQRATKFTVKAVKDIINVILKVSGSDRSCDDLFTVSISYESVLNNYFIFCEDNYEQFKDTIEKIWDNENIVRAYSKLIETGLVGDVLPTIEEFADGYEKPIDTDISIVPKGEVNPSDIAVLNQINHLFEVESYDNY